ncbi:MAG: C-GCAxxG-C-C family (seleno)protein, partial [Bacillota bacterium]
MNEQLVLEARNKCGDYFKQGYNCTESIFLAFRDLVTLDIEQSLVRMMTGFGGGLGHAGCMCGALTSSAVVLGVLKGRTSTDQDREE